MEEFLKHIETYNLMNYLFPGIIFGAMFSYIYGKNIYDTNVIIATFEYYFTGLVLSRIGSVIIKPILERLKIIESEEYKNYIEKENDKINLLQRESNQYRTFIAVFIVLIIIEMNNCIFGDRTKSICIIYFSLLVILFILSYRKQNKFILNRIGDTTKNK